MADMNLPLSPQGKNHIALNDAFGAHNYHPLPVVLARGKGEWVWDVDGKRYLDMLSAYSAVNQGHCHERLIQTLIEQSAKVNTPSTYDPGCAGLRSCEYDNAQDIGVWRGYVAV